jgi:hypothetical protein
MLNSADKVWIIDRWAASARRRPPDRVTVSQLRTYVVQPAHHLVPPAATAPT